MTIFSSSDKYNNSGRGGGQKKNGKKMTEREYHRDGFIIGKDGQKIIRREKNSWCKK